MTLSPSMRRPETAAALPNPAAMAEPMAARLEARIQALAAEPADVAPRRQLTTSADGLHPARPPSAEVDDLNQQLELLRSQLEAAFDDVETRIAAAEQRALAAEAAAAAADTRAQVASARAANVLYSVDDLAHELKHIANADGADHPSLSRLLGAVGRLRSRLQSPEFSAAPSAEPTIPQTG